VKEALKTSKLGDFEYEKTLGAGNFGEVRNCDDPVDTVMP
jgi:hypothetical protein